MTAVDGVRAYLETVRALTKTRVGYDGYAYKGPADLVLQRGTVFTPSPFPRQYARSQGVPQHCFDNAYVLATRTRGRLRYVEGYAAGIIPVEHGWCVDVDDRVVDPTWPDGVGVAYLGIVVDLEVVRRARRTENASALFDWQRRYPLCR